MYQKDNKNLIFAETLFKSVHEYNSTIHSVTNRKPIELFFGIPLHEDPQQAEKARLENIELLKQKQIKDLEYHNRNRIGLKTYNEGDVIYVKVNKRKGSKLTPRF